MHNKCDMRCASMDSVVVPTVCGPMHSAHGFSFQKWKPEMALVGGPLANQTCPAHAWRPLIAMMRSACPLATLPEAGIHVADNDCQGGILVLAGEGRPTQTRVPSAGGGRFRFTGGAAPLPLAAPPRTALSLSAGGRGRTISACAPTNGGCG